MNKIKLLLLLSVIPLFACAARASGFKWNKSPIEKVHLYVDSSFISDITVCKKGNSFVPDYYDFFNVYCTVSSTYTSDYVSAFTTTGALTNVNYSASAHPTGSYSDQTAEVITQSAGLSFNIATNFVGGENGLNVWVDYDDDGIFDDDEKVFTATGAVAHNGTITIPATVAIGEYRMRVRGQWGSTANPPACGNISWGSTVDFTLVVLAVPTCMPPSNLILNGVTDTAMTYSWTAGATETSWEVIHQLSTAPAPTAASTGTIVPAPTYTTTTVLTPNTIYNFYVRAVCSDTDKSFWINLSNKRTSLVPIPMPLIEDFEDGSSDFVFTESTVNKWHIGTATACSGTQSMYISNNNGVANAYTTSAGTVAHAYTDVAIPANAAEASFSFDYKLKGYGTTIKYDYFKVWLVPASYQPVAGTQITAANSGGIQLGNSFNLQETCTNYLQVFNIAQYAGSSQRVVFEWINSTFGFSSQPPAAIDNINFALITCPRPIINEVIKNNAGQMVLSWTPQGTETAWELVIQPVNSGLPTGTSTIIPVNGVPQYVFTPTQGEIYEFYVRAVCTTEDKSLWQGPETFSDFNPPACAEIDVTPLDLNLNPQGEYVICEGEDHVINLEAAFDPSKFKATTSYEVESIDYAPPFPFVGGTQMNVSIDDTWSPVIGLPFDVCFYGNNFTTAQVGSNGMVTFGTDHCQTAGCAPWTIGNITFPSPTYDNRLRNAIMGVYQDIDPRPTVSPNANINYQILGTYPCRALVVNFYDIYQYNCEDDLPPQNSQIVIYEITNIIEVYVEKRIPCDGHNSGRGAIGLINADGTQATIPPGRNVGNWTTELEAWRFNPSGETNVTFGWYMDGVLISNDPSHQVTINESHTFEARVTYPGCTGGEDLVLSKSFTVKISEEIELGEPEDLIFCTDNMEDEDRPRITDNYEEIMSLITNKNEFLVTYHRTLKEAEEGIGAIPNPEDYIPGSFPETIYVRVMSLETECYEVVSFDVIEGEKPLELTQEDVIICNKYALPSLGKGQEYMYYDYVNFGTGSTTRVEKPAVGAMLTPGDYTVHVLSTSEDGCYEEFSFQIKVFPCIIPKGISPNGDGDNDYLDLADYMVQDIKIFNRYGKEVYSHGQGYKREWHGQDNSGNLLPTGTYYYNIITPFEQFTGYIYMMREVK